jgi:hypothetical protein
MNARLHAVQRVMWALVVASVALALLSFPRGNNRAYSAALDELTGFAGAFKQGELEKTLLDYARAQGTLQPAEVQKLITGPQVPKLQLSAAVQPILPLAADIHLRTLGEVMEHSKPDSTLDIGALNPAPLVAAIAWRLARVTPTPPRYEITNITIEPSQYTPADIELEAGIGKSRIETAAAEKAAAEAEKKLATAEDVFEARRKRKLPWKILLKFDEVRKTARETLSERQRTLEETRTRYEAEVKRAEATAARPAAASGPLPTAYALAQVVLRGEAGNVTTLRVPVALNIQKAKLPSLAGTSFSATREAGLWDEAKDQNATQAIVLTRSKFTWHYRYAELAGVRIGGMTLLQVLPCILPLLLLALLSRIRRVSGTYNPFGTTLREKLPRVGLGSRTLELAVLVLLPLGAVVLTSFALWAVSQVPILPAIAALAAVGLGGYAFVELGSLQELLEAVVRSHSNPPANPEGNTAL